MNLIKNLRLRVLVLLMVGAGIVATTFLAAARVHSAWVEARQYEQSLDLIQLVGEVQDFVVHLQNERSASIGFIASGGADFANDLSGLRNATDAGLLTARQALAALTLKSGSPLVESAVDRLLAPLDRLARTRDLVDAQALSIGDANAMYTQVTDTAAELSQKVANTMPSAGIILSFSAFSAMQSALDQAGIERAIAAASFASGAIDEQDVARLTGIVVAQSALLDQANRFATAEEKEALKEARFGDAAKTVLSLRNAFLGGEVALLADTSVRTWFEAAEVRIDGLIKIQDTVFNRSIDQTQSQISRSRSNLYSLAIAMTLLVACSLALIMLLYAVTIGQFRAVISAISGLADGDLDVNIPPSRPNEFGEISSALRRFHTNATERLELEKLTALQTEMQQKVVGDLRDALSRAASGDLRVTLSDPFEESYEELRQDFNRAFANLSKGLGDVDGTAGLFHKQTSQMDQVSDDLANRMDSQASALADSVASLDELTANVAAAAKTAATTSEGAQGVRQLANDSKTVVEEAIASIEEVEGASSKISKIVDLIDDLSFQTNLLSLNAGVEAARAGESGRGFAVVAQEVGALAQRSADSAKDIRELIKTSEASVIESASCVRKTADALGEVMDGVASIATGVGEMANASRRQSNVLSEINGSLANIDKMTQTTVDVVQENKSVSRTLAGGASDLQSVLSAFSFQHAAKPELKMVS